VRVRSKFPVAIEDLVKLFFWFILDASRQPVGGHISGQVPEKDGLYFD
jgi:hypothetical protein